MTPARSFIGLVLSLLLLAGATPLRAQETTPANAITAPVASAATDPAALVAAMGEANLRELGAIVTELAATEDTAVVPALQALAAGTLYLDKATGAVVIVAGGNRLDPLTQAVIGPESAADLTRIRVNNSLRRDIAAALGAMTLMNDDPRTRMSAARAMMANVDDANLPLLDEAIAAETDTAVRALMQVARGVTLLRSADASLADKLAAVPVVAQSGERDAATVLTAARANAPAELDAAIASALAGLEQERAVWNALQNVWFGISLGSVLLLAAIGLAITFGVMGVINMAHGEMVMLGAYTTFLVQLFIRQNFPGLLDYSLLIALPAAFLVTAAIGVGIERGIIRWLYGRPLETLLATWGLSLILQQAVRTTFGPTNQMVIAPTWMSGSFQFYGLSITYGRFWIVIFAMIVFALLLLVLNRTALGLQMRAVTQNRRMASAMGIRTPFVDAMTFGLGSGIAGLAGVALTQIDNISPNLGQNYIIDSFMVVVFGGVGNLWGTLVGAMTLGIANKFLEPYAGAVLGKILILVLIILFIQRRPRGLFALKGRAVEQ
ncbi:amino acid/amide ABC transporter membrane protein 1, HAAT family (TC 3.A.1.4.-) [Devosia enhydra]|uniref:Amino acid/amide ABC transporter membrane protein 1, HAAT family (TC 3.A.1.4.-) n=1 Tax=Devosia enhydra TaxID=665118 RepID=A0A1K2HXF0_9HYPH|nr:urea ABC transporter permease subunit UrtB [Devosia enhydra]SFZ82960.1 amino acid/amide ABC transporter membrane protein 1, HAAT family (TC 3.A.1.4.-) [Devosia enhydra]